MDSDSCDRKYKSALLYFINDIFFVILSPKRLKETIYGISQRTFVKTAR